MGICYYSQQYQWQTLQTNYRTRRKNTRKANLGQIIYQQRSVVQSFAPQVKNSFRQDLYSTLNQIAKQYGSVAIGSVVQLSPTELQALHKSLQAINSNGQDFNPNQVITLCNLKTKNFLHTHKIKHPTYKRSNQVSACPYNSNHIIQYDLWKIIVLPNQHYYIYHPLTQTFLGVENGIVVCNGEKCQWKIKDFGRRRNKGFIQLLWDNNQQQTMQLCMTDQPAILDNHRKLKLCKENHIGHLWELQFGQCVLDYIQ